MAIGRQSTIGFNGTDVCSWLTDAGVTCILVKYRVADTACNWNRETRRHEAPDIPMAVQDAQRAIAIDQLPNPKVEIVVPQTDPAKDLGRQMGQVVREQKLQMKGRAIRRLVHTCYGRLMSANQALH